MNKQKLKGLKYNNLKKNTQKVLNDIIGCYGILRVLMNYNTCVSNNQVIKQEKITKTIYLIRLLKVKVT